MREIEPGHGVLRPQIHGKPEHGLGIDRVAAIAAALAAHVARIPEEIHEVEGSERPQSLDRSSATVVESGAPGLGIRQRFGRGNRIPELIHISHRHPSAYCPRAISEALSCRRRRRRARWR